MKTVILDEFIFRTTNENIFGHGYISGWGLQYFGGNTGYLIHWTPTYHRRLDCEKVNVDTTTSNTFSLIHNPFFKQSCK